MSVMVDFYVIFFFIAIFFHSIGNAETHPGLFLMKKKGHRLKDSLLRTIKAENQIVCASHCAIYRSKCKSFNFIADQTDQINCELNSKIAETDNDENIVANPNAKYFEKINKDEENIVVPTCESFPCQNGGTCSHEGEEGFKCTCKRDWTGLVCTEKESLATSVALQGNASWIIKLQDWLPEEQQGKSMALCYRASRDGWESTTFHSFCDDKERTIVLVKCGIYVFGGYAAAPWGGASGYRRADGSFLFSFENKDKLAPFKSPMKKDKHENALFISNQFGPTFGGGYDLRIGNNANTGTYSGFDYGNTYEPPSGYVRSNLKTQQLLAGSPSFIASEVEVYYFDNAK